MGGPHLVVVVTVVVMVAAWARGAVFRVAGDATGACGSGFLAITVLSDTVCAMKCTQNGLCGGFSFVKDVVTSSGICRLHENLSSPDGNPDATCFVLSETRTTTTNTSTTTTAITASTTTTTTITITIPTFTTAITATSKTEAATPSTTAPDNTDTSHQIETSSTGVTAASITSTVASTVAPGWSLTGSDFVKVGTTCDSDSGAVGLIEEGDWLLVRKVMCLSPPPELAFNTPDPTEKCTESLIKKCMTKACPSDTIYVGPKMTWTGFYGPCSGGFTSTVATLDTTDCHVVEGTLQPSPAIASSSWKQWRYCEGDSTHFYVMTEVIVTHSSTTTTLTSIKCCRVRPL